MDYLTVCYYSKMRPYRDRPDIEVNGRWRWCPPGAKHVPFTHSFGSHTMDPGEQRIDPPLGEVPLKNGNTKGESNPRYTGQHFCGNASAWLNGINYADAVPLEVDEEGIPLCCAAPPLEPGGLVMDGEAVQGLTEPTGVGVGVLVQTAAYPSTVAGVYASLGVRWGVAAYPSAAPILASVGLKFGTFAGTQQVAGVVTSVGFVADLGVGGIEASGIVAGVGVAFGISAEASISSSILASVGFKFAASSEATSIAGILAGVGFRAGMFDVPTVVEGQPTSLGVAFDTSINLVDMSGYLASVGFKLGVVGTEAGTGGFLATLGFKLGVVGTEAGSGGYLASVGFRFDARASASSSSGHFASLSWLFGIGARPEVVDPEDKAIQFRYGIATAAIAIGPINATLGVKFGLSVEGGGLADVPRVGDIVLRGNPTAENGFLPCDGAAISRTTYATLYDLLHADKTGVAVTNGSTTMTITTGYSGLFPGMLIVSPNVPAGTRILSVGANIQMSNPATGTSSGQLATFHVFGGGNGSTTFNLPNLAGRVPVGVGSLSGGGTYRVGDTAGAETVTLATGHLPAHSHQLKSDGSSVFDVGGGASALRYHITAQTILTGSGTRTADEGGGTAHDNMQPYIALYYFICVFTASQPLP